jgi:hypothetical protein
LLIISAATFALISPCLAGGVNRELLTRQNQILLQLQKAAVDRMAAAVERAAAQLRLFCREAGHFPSGPEESRLAETEIAALMPTNPFLFPTPTAYESPHAQVRDEDRIRVAIRIDRHLNDEAVLRFLEFPPDDWQAPPGTIVVVTDGNRLAAIWASGADQRPIRDPLTARLRMIIARCGT